MDQSGRKDAFSTSTPGAGPRSRDGQGDAWSLYINEQRGPIGRKSGSCKFAVAACVAGQLEKPTLWRDAHEKLLPAAILAEKRRCLARNIGASLPPAQCEACGRGEVQAHMRDDESRAQLHWACRQTTQCHQDHDREWIEWAVI